MPTGRSVAGSWFSPMRPSLPALCARSSAFAPEARPTSSLSRRPLTGRLGYWTGDNRRSRRDAEERLGLCLDSLRDSGVAARGKVGDADPLQALEDALREFDADEIIVATRPESRSNWRASDIVGRARRRFSRPISQIAA